MYEEKKKDGLKKLTLKWVKTNQLQRKLYPILWSVEETYKYSQKEILRETAGFREDEARLFSKVQRNGTRDNKQKLQNVKLY